jgi:GntR family transcriptional regulator
VLFDHLDPRLPTPLYAQIADRVRVTVANGELVPGDALPSVRSLAGRLRVNPATVVQAYRDLESEGLVEMRQGAGSFIANVAPEQRRRARATAARKLVRDMLADAARHGISTDELRGAFDAESGGNR